MNLVLGAGPAGLIAGYLLRIPVVGEVVGGQQAEVYSLGPRIFELTNDSIKLFESLGIDWQNRVKEYRVGYARVGSPTQATIPDDQFRLDYYRKTRDPNADTFPESCLSGGKNVITGIDLDLVVNELKRHVAVIPGRVHYVNRTRLGYQVTCTTQTPEGYSKITTNLPCEHLISTIPLPVLVKTMNKPVEMERPKSKSTYFAWVYTGCFSIDPFKSGEDEFDYVYVADPSCLFHRVTKIAPGIACLEFENADRLHQFKATVERKYLLDTRVVPGAQLTNKLGLQEYQGITLLGRYGTWDHGVKLEDVVKEVYEYAGEMGIRPEGSSLWL